MSCTSMLRRLIALNIKFEPKTKRLSEGRKSKLFISPDILNVRHSTLETFLSAGQGGEWGGV